MTTIRVTPIGASDASGIPIEVPEDALCVVAVRGATSVHSVDHDRLIAEVIITGHDRPWRRGVIRLGTACDEVDCSPTRRQGRHVFLHCKDIAVASTTEWVLCLMETWRQRAERFEASMHEGGGA